MLAGELCTLIRDSILYQNMKDGRPYQCARYTDPGKIELVLLLSRPSSVCCLVLTMGCELAYVWNYEIRST
jgi:hypothetical protein